MKTFSKLTWPYIAWITAFVVMPMLLILLYAFTVEGNGVITFHFTLANFAKFFSDAIFPMVLWRSLKIAFLTTVICILVGYPCAYLIAQMPEKKQEFAILLITLPMWINMLIRTYSWKGILAYFNFDSQINVMVGMVYNFLPFMILQIHTALSKLDRNLITAANDLGANDVQTFLKVTLPLSIPGVISGITLVFLPAVSSFFIPKLLGGGEYVLIGNLIENYFISVGNWNYGSAISLIMALVIILSMYVTKKLDKKTGGEE
ncbi:MAG: ABC transporter permease [Erysipelotrichaceae bacterium]|nr:ABC transporter permease [Erysipelotrichaceae bacterium]